MDESGRRSAPSPAYVIGDVHGHRTELVEALRAAGLVDEDAAWCGDTARVWFLGDFFDRGPDGVAVVELVMGLAEQAGQAGGSVRALLGNHEILTLGMHRFGDTEVPSDFGSRSFERSWRLNGGQQSDQDALTDEHLTWLSGLSVMDRVGDYLLMHSDTVEYLGWGQSMDEINDAVRAVLAGDDIELWWDCWRRMTTRYAFRGPDGPATADSMLAIFGGDRIVHGHSVIADQLGVPPPLVEGPCLYADGKVLGIDAGVFVGGPCLVVPLPGDSDEEPELAVEIETETEDAVDEAAIEDTAAEPDSAVVAELVDDEGVPGEIAADIPSDHPADIPDGIAEEAEQS